MLNKKNGVLNFSVSPLDGTLIPLAILEVQKKPLISGKSMYQVIRFGLQISGSPKIEAQTQKFLLPFYAHLECYNPNIITLQ